MYEYAYSYIYTLSMLHYYICTYINNVSYLILFIVAFYADTEM
jgi:hypothetical protein